MHGCMSGMVPDTVCMLLQHYVYIYIYISKLVTSNHYATTIGLSAFGEERH